MEKKKGKQVEREEKLEWNIKRKSEQNEEEEKGKLSSCERNRLKPRWVDSKIWDQENHEPLIQDPRMVFQKEERGTEVCCRRTV